MSSFDLDALLDLLLETQTLDRIPRIGFLQRGVAAPESVSEHSFHVAITASFLVETEPALDPLKVLRLALLHDLAEVRLGDLPRIAQGYLPRGAKRQAEEAVLADLVAPLGSAGDAVRALVEADSAERRFVKACDRLQLLIKVRAYEAAGHRGLDDFWQAPDEWAQEFAAIRDLAASIRRERDRPTC